MIVGLEWRMIFWTAAGFAPPRVHFAVGSQKRALFRLRAACQILCDDEAQQKREEYFASG